MQTAQQSVIESLTSNILGIIVSFLTQLYVFPLVGIHIELHTNFLLIAIFTAVSFVRSYAVRRFFNMLEMRKMSNERV
jgi:ABC-type antimicrobial peptide transport system permease subunit